MNMSEDIHLPPLLQERSNEIDSEREISAKHENDTNCCASPSAESASTGQHVCLTEHDVVSEEVSSPCHKDSDGGWGWVIVVGVFFITSLIGGVNVSFSLLYLEFVDMFGASRAVVGGIGSVYIFMNNVLGTNDNCLFFFNEMLFC